MRDKRGRMPRLRSTSLHDGWQLAETSWQRQPPPDAPKLAGARVGYSRLEWLPARVPGPGSTPFRSCERRFTDTSRARRSTYGS
jgi:hypothetical protein